MLGRPLAFLVLAGAASLRAQAPLTLGDAFRRADSAAFANRIAAGDARERRAGITAALQGVLPTVRAEAGYARTDDPLAAFGFLLQQRGVSSASFDPGQLNHPAPVENWSGGVVAQVPLLNADAWFGRGAASRASAAGEAAAGWTRETVRADVTRAYFGAILAAQQARTLDAGVAAGRAHLRAAESLVANGLATRSDALIASVELGRIDLRLLEARGFAGIARGRLALLLGRPADTAFTLPDSLPSTDRIRGLPPLVDPGGDRLDVTVARLSLEAARHDLRRARAKALPRLNGFGRYEWNSPDQAFGGRRGYTVGLVASWSPFGGVSGLADRRASEGRADAARAMADSAEAGAALERSTALIRLSVAMAQLGIAEGAVAQAAEAHRIVTRKYAGGLATVAELLGAAALDTQTRLGLAEARYQAIAAGATARHAVGADLLALTALEK
jgi:outer membrane protein TolC